MPWPGRLKPHSGRVSSGRITDRSAVTLKSPASTQISPGPASASANVAARSTSASGMRLSFEPVAWKFAIAATRPSPTRTRTAWQTRRSLAQ